MTDIKKKIFLFGYYVNNLFFVKFLSKIIWYFKKREFSDRWYDLQKQSILTSKNEWLVVGNGPSLNKNDLEALSFLPAIASNKIGLIFDSTSWRPNNVTICDALLAYKLKNYDFGGVEEVFCAERVYPLLHGVKKLAWKDMSFDDALEKYRLNKTMDADPVTGLFEGYTVTVQNIQLAIWLGAKRVYLIGCDHFYDEQQIEKHGGKIESDACNHFHKNYRKKGEVVNNAPISVMNLGYEMVNSYAEQKGVEIINISRKSYLELFPKDTVENIVEKNNLKMRGDERIK